MDSEGQVLNVGLDEDGEDLHAGYGLMDGFKYCYANSVPIEIAMSFLFMYEFLLEESLQAGRMHHQFLNQNTLNSRRMQCSGNREACDQIQGQQE